MRKRRSPTGPGYTIAQFAADPDVQSTPAAIRSAVKRGHIKAFDFNGVKRIPPSEKVKYLAVWREAAE